jgi:hypothetical protein
VTAPLPEQAQPAAPAGNDTVKWARVALTVVLALVGWHAFHDEYGSVPLLSDVDLAIHEFGHVLFMPFGIPLLGNTMVILGGSLFQVVFPLIFVGYFLWRREGGRRDVHAAMVSLWWASMNVLSVAIYCADARAGVLMLITGETGQESDAHDWKNLLTRWGMLKRDTIIAAQMRGVAWLLFWTSIAVGLVAAWQYGHSETRDVT